MSISYTIKKIKKLEEMRGQLIKQILNVREMVKASYGETYRKCGKPTCWCAENKGHPFRRITWSENGKTRTKSIPQKDIEWIKLETEAYKNFRNHRHELRILELQLKEQLNHYENLVVIKTKNSKDYLG